MSTGNNKTQLLVRSQLPEFIANDYPKFVEFLKAYYTFVSNNYNIGVEALRDADNTSTALLGFLRKELLKNFPTAAINERKLITTIRQLYSRKGNLDSIKLLFKLFFNDSVIIRQPGSQILKASDGKWFQYNIITLSQINWEKVSGDILRAAVKIEPYKTRFDTVVNTYKVGDVNRSGSVTSADALAVSRYSLNPQNVTPTQKTHIESVLIPTLFGNPNFSEYLFSSLNEADIVPEISRLVIENKFGRFTPTISKFEIEENKKLRLFFKSYTNLEVIRGQQISITGEDGSVVFTGRHVASTNALRVINPGKNWQRGQIITVPGSLKDTIARVVEIDSQGGLVRVEVLENGFSHDEDLAVIISPYPVKPSANAAYDVNTTITAVDGSGNPTAYAHVIALNEYTEGTTETLYGEKNPIDYSALGSEIINAASLVEPAATLFNIVDSGWKIGDINHSGSVTAADARIISLYAADPNNVTSSQRTHIETILIPKLKALQEAINPASPPTYTGILYSIINPFSPAISSSTTETTSISYNFSELTFEEWVESRATLAFDKSDIVKTRGYYLNDESQISNNESRLQDNYFYQLYSYLIETTKTGDEVTSVLNQFHPAGLKYFFQLNKQNFYSIRDILESYRALSTDVVFLRDITANADVIAKSFAKVLEDILDSYLEPIAKDFTKVIATETGATTEEVIKFVTKPLSDAYAPADADPIKDFTKVSTDATAPADADPIKSATKLATPDASTPSDADPIKDFTKVSTDTGTPADADPIKDFTKVSTDGSAPADADPIKDFTKLAVPDTGTPSDADPIKDFTKVSTDAGTPADSAVKDFTRLADTDTGTPSDADPIKDFTKASTDTGTPSDADPIKAFSKTAQEDSGVPDDTTIGKTAQKLADADTSSPSDSDPSKQTAKVASDGSTPVDDPAKTFTRPVPDDIVDPPTDAAPIKTFGKNPSDTQSYSDATPIFATTKAVSDIPLVNDETINKNFTKYTEQDTATLNEGSFISISAEGFAAANDYVASTENYSQLALEAYIG